MIEDAGFDKEISHLVRTVAVEVPPTVDARINAAAVHIYDTRHRSRLRRFWLLIAIPSAVVGLLLIAVLRGPSRIPQPNPQISEIRTQFELVDKNIKVIFIQRPDFVLKEDINE